MARTKKPKVSYEISEGESAHQIQDKIVVVKERKTYAFKNQRGNDIFFPREDGTYGHFEPMGIIDDITERERKILLNSSDFKEGELFEVIDGELSVQEIAESGNRIDISAIERMLKSCEKDFIKYQKWMDGIDSVFTLENIIAALVRSELPKMFSTYAEFRLATVQSFMEDALKAPVENIAGE